VITYTAVARDLIATWLDVTANEAELFAQLGG
jgi:hypothetical protein